MDHRMSPDNDRYEGYREGLPTGGSLNALALAHRFLTERVPPGGLCIDATMGRGRDTAFLCSLVGAAGRVLAFDIQQEALDSTAALLEKENLSGRAKLLLDSHSNMASYAQPDSVDAIAFNFGWLPGGDHTVFTMSESSIPAIRAGLELLKPGGVMSLCIYYGKDSGFAERDALLDYLQTVDNDRFTVLVTTFANRPNNPPIPAFIIKTA